MHRQPLLAALNAYLRRHPEEQAMTTHFLEFVAAEPRCFERALAAPGHVTGSAWIVDDSGESVLLTHHRKLDLWIQLGGHADGDPDVLAVARREGLEESGLEVLDVLDPLATAPAGTGMPVPFDIDIHEIPARHCEPAHLHFDVRFAFRSRDRAIQVSDESHALAWVPWHRLADYSTDVSVQRMAEKWRNRPLATQ